MKYAIYFEQQNGDIECEFYGTLELAKARIAHLIKDCEIQWANDPERNCPTVDITLLEVKGEVVFTPDGLRLLAR